MIDLSRKKVKKVFVAVSMGVVAVSSCSPLLFCFVDINNVSCFRDLSRKKVKKVFILDWKGMLSPNSNELIVVYIYECSFYRHCRPCGCLCDLMDNSPEELNPSSIR